MFAQRPGHLLGVLAASVALVTLVAAPVAARKPTPAALVFDTSSHDFGTIDPGLTASRTFVLTNDGGSASGRLDIAVVGLAFAAVADTCTGTSVGGGKSCSVVVTYAPDTAGQSDTGSLTASGRKVVGTTVSLAGQGTPAPTAHIYWSEVNGSAIWRADLDGTDAQVFIADAAWAEGMARDADHFYWASTFWSAVGRANLDGSGVEHEFVTTTPMPRAVAVDGNYIYWVNYWEGTIGRANLDGSNPDDQFITGAALPRGLAVNGTHIYWTNSQTFRIGRADIDGSNVNQSFLAPCGHPKGIEVDTGHVYWADSCGIGRANLDGSNPEPNWITAPWPAAISAYGDYLYWVNPIDGLISRANLDGSGATTLISGVANDPQGLMVR